MTRLGARACPSSVCAPGNLLIGIVMPDGHVAGVRPPLEVDEQFTDAAAAGPRPPEARFRFAGPCVEERCQHWIGRSCRIAAVTAAATGSIGPLQPCPIRATCRWWAQEGAAACTTCPQVVHTLSPRETPVVT